MSIFVSQHSGLLKSVAGTFFLSFSQPFIVNSGIEAIGLMISPTERVNISGPKDIDTTATTNLELHLEEASLRPPRVTFTRANLGTGFPTEMESSFTEAEKRGWTNMLENSWMEP